MNDIFDPIIEELFGQDIGIYGPIHFFDYLDENGIKRVSAPRYISVDSLEVLSKTLQNNDAMVMRLGQGNFVIVKTKNKLKDFFLVDKDIFTEEGELFYPQLQINQLKAYKFLPKLTENSLVNLGFSSGLISYALNLDNSNPIFPPATCNSTFTFEFLPLSSAEKTLTHKQGQVEIDAMFVEKRNGKETLFIIEAKSGNTHKSLAKHKLVYPILGIANNVPSDIQIVPVYIKVISNQKAIHYHIVECEFPNPRERITAYTELKIKNYKHMVLPIEILNGEGN